jgi:hypothetical protein
LSPCDGLSVEFRVREIGDIETVVGEWEAANL